MIKRVLLGLLLLCQMLAAQEVFSDRIKGFRVYGTSQAGLPIAGLESRPITIEFDVAEMAPPDIHLRVKHCDRDWNVTATSFINDEMQNKSKAPLQFDRAPDGVQFYRHHYTVRIPGLTGLERFPQSGNYFFEIMDEQWNTVLARGRFFVAETILSPSVKISNRSLPSEINPFNQVNKIEVGFTLPGPEAFHGEIFYPIKLKVVDILRNRQLYSARRIDADDQDPNTFVDGFGTSKMKFVVDNIQPGSSYRHLDLRSVSDYPEGQQLAARRGADVSRFLHPPGGDNSGISTLTSGSRYADYVPYRFELSSESAQYDSVFVVGDFNGWKPSVECLMTYDVGSHRYFWQTLFRRGAYDYQYVVGSNDWIAVEGNDWRTISVYTALIYYHDDRYGGFDRIIGFAQLRSPGGDEPTSE
jgi:hypothetical protein